MRFDIETIKRKMLVKYPFYGSVVANVEYRANTNIPTAGTDGKVIHYNPEFLEKLSIEEQIFTFAHEICHIAFNHILRSEGKDPEVWNIATDAVINAFLKRDGLKMVEGGVDIADAINYDAEQLYDKLLQEKQQQNQKNQSQQQNNDQKEQSQQNQSGQGDSKEQNQQEKLQDSQTQSQNNQGQSQNSESQTNQNDNSESNNTSSSSNEEQEKQQDESQSDRISPSNSESQGKKNSSSLESPDSSSQDEKKDVGHDTHSMWEDAIRKHKEEQIKDKKENTQEQSEIEKKQEEIEQLGEKEAFKKNLEEKKKELEELKKALSRQTMGPGSSTNSDVRNITDIGRAKPLIDWRYVLRESIKYDVDWSYRNAYIEDGIIRANLEEQQLMPETEILIDTSGSIDEMLLKNFLRECKNILHHSRVKVGCFDTKFYGFHEIRTEEDIENMKFVGGGGTNFDVAVGAFSRRVENKIIFTDGDAYMPDMPLDAIWIVFGGKKINPKGGRVIDIKEEQLESLHYFEMNNSNKGRSR